MSARGTRRQEHTRVCGSAAPAVCLQDVRVRFGTAEILRGVTFDVYEQRVTALTGPSGGGKTTLLRLCNRLEVPTSGTVSFRGIDVSTMDPLALRRRVGMVFQRPTLFGGTVRDNLRVARPDGDEAYRVVLDRVGLARAMLDHRADDLSGGEAQRACLARTLLTEPEVLLMDEPTSSLDRAATGVLEGLTAELVRQGMTVLWVSHDLAQVRRIADERVVLLEGQVATEERARSYLGAPAPQIMDREGEDPW